MTSLDQPALSVRQLVSPLYAMYADRIAAVDRDQQVSFGELGDRALRVANALRDKGLEAGDRVAVIAENSVDWIIAEHAFYAGGFVRVAALTRLHPKELGRIVADAGAKAIFVDPSWLDGAGPDWIPACVEHIVTLGSSTRGAVSLADLERAGGNSDIAPVDDDALSWIAYTSGSTGVPKGVTYTQRTLGATMRNTMAELGPMTADDVALHTAPLSHFSGAIALAATISGACNLIHRGFDIEAALESIADDGVTILPLVPTQILALTDALQARADAGRQTDLSRIRLLPYAGSAIPPDRLALAIRFFGGSLMQFYGAQEAPMPLTSLRPEHHTLSDGPGGQARLASAGRRTANVEIKIVGPDGTEQPVGEVGEICARGEQITKGYWNNPVETAEVLSADGWLRTGDLGKFDDEGFLYIVDRKKDMVVSGGFNVFPREVENAISVLPGVREVAVVGAPSERWGEEVTAMVSLVPGATLTEEEVIAHCRTEIAGYKAPKRVVIVDDLPKTGTGKIHKVAIRDELWAGRDRKI